MAVGRRFDEAAEGYSISIWAGTSDLGFQRLAVHTGWNGNQSPGEWVARRVSLSTFGGNQSQHIGKQLRIELFGYNLGKAQVNFDEAGLEVSDTPEPAAERRRFASSRSAEVTTYSNNRRV